MRGDPRGCEAELESFTGALDEWCRSLGFFWNLAVVPWWGVSAGQARAWMLLMYSSRDWELWLGWDAAGWAGTSSSVSVMVGSTGGEITKRLRFVLQRRKQTRRLNTASVVDVLDLCNVSSTSVLPLKLLHTLKWRLQSVLNSDLQVYHNLSLFYKKKKKSFILSCI